MTTTNVKVILPMSMRALADGQSSLDVQATTISDAVAQLVDSHSDLKGFLQDDEGRPLAYLNFFVNESSIAADQWDQFALNDGDELLIVSAIAGG